MSPKSTADKLLIKPNARVWSSHPERLELVGPPPAGAHVVDRPEDATVALLFGDDGQSLRDAVTAHAQSLAAPEALWVAYPKGNRTDINRDTVWPILARHGLRPIAQVAVDEVWSALRFRPLRPGEAPFGVGKGS